VIVTVTPNPVLDRTLTVERIVSDEVTRATAVQLDWGGKGFNVSRALQQLGMESMAMGFVGGATGQMLERGLHDLGIATDFVVIAGETRTNIVVREAHSDHYIKVNEAGPLVTQDEWERFMEQVRERVQEGDIWVLAGSLPPGVPADFHARLIALLQQRGARAFLDSSGEPLCHGCAAAPTLVKPNALEAAEVTGCETDCSGPARLPEALQAARCLLDKGIEFVALSLGAEGMLLASHKEAVWAWPPALTAGNPTGAGDALLAGIVWAMVEGLPLKEVARWGVACGTASAAGEGVGAGTREEVEAWYGKVNTNSEPGWEGS
jgi:1-phosphofructokinase family hexose kinase